MNFWTYQNLATITGGTWRSAPADEPAVLPAAAQDTGAILCHDTRELTPGQCYLAIKGENFDGHDFTEQAFKQGASLAIVDADSAQAHGFAQQRCGITTAPILAVPDTVKALQDLARAYRNVLAAGECKVIGVAGSNGKTTTRHLIHHVMTHAGKRGTQSPKSFNNHLGVPLTLLAARPTDDFLACEIGTNHPGEIDFLSAIARPDIAVITSIGEEHLEFLGDIEGVAREELMILNHVIDDGPAVLGDGKLNNILRKRFPDLEGWIKKRVSGKIIKRPKVNLRRHMPRFIGAHNAINGSIAAAVAQWLGIKKDRWEAALVTATPPPHRMVRLEFGHDVVVIDDCYNANPTSMELAIHALYREAKGRAIPILGDMLELGNASEFCHGRIGGIALVKMIYGQMFIFIGQEMCQHAACDDFIDNKQCVCFPEWSDNLPEKIAALLDPGDTVLLKASRGMRLERLIPAIEARFGKAQDTDG